MAAVLYKLYILPQDDHSKHTKKLLEELQVQFEEIDVTGDEASVNKLVEHTGQWQVPAFIAVDAANPNGPPVARVVGYEAEAIRHMVKELSK